MASPRANTNRRRSRRWSISNALSLQLVASVLCLGLVTAPLLSLRIGDLLDTQMQTHAGSQVRAIATDFPLQLDTHLSVLNDHAGFPIMIQALMQPETHGTLLADFMEELGFLGEPAREVLLDFRGRTVSASPQAPDFDYATLPWVRELLRGQRDRYRGVSQFGGIHYWRLAVPVRYNGVPEGVLVTEVPFEALDRRMGLSKRLEGVQMELLLDGQAIHWVGSAATGPVFKEPGPVPNSHLRFRIDDSTTMAIRNQTIREFGVLVALMVLLIGWLSVRSARRWFIEPIRALQRLMADVANGAGYEAHQQRQSLKELDDLSYGFVRMAAKVSAREQSIVAASQELTAANERLRASQKQLIQSEKMASLGTLAAGVAHEINNPIGFIQSNIGNLREYQAVLLPLVEDYRDLVRARAEAEPELLEKWNRRLQGEDLDFLLEDMESLVKDTAEGSRRVAEIVAGLRKFSHSGGSRDEWLDVNDCVSTALNLVGNELKYKAEVVEQYLGELPLIRGNQGQITQVLVNLLVNAAQAMDSPGRIKVETRVLENSVLVRVSDTGHGISAEHMDHLFTPFFTTKEVGTGTGLGLSISHGLVESHGGSISVESEPGRGSVFSVELPLSPDSRPPTEGSEA